MDQYAQWKRMVAGEKVAISPDAPLAGFYRVRVMAGGPLLPIAFWYKDGELRARVVNDNIDKARALELWPYAADKPVEHAHYNAAIKDGRWWDDDATVADARENPIEQTGDKATDLAAQIAQAAAGIGAYAVITTDEQAGQSQVLRSRLLELKRTAEKAHKDERGPIKAQLDAIDAKWKAPITSAETSALAINRAQNAYEDEKLRARRAEEDRLRREREEQARLAREAAERAADETRRQEAERRAQSMDEDGPSFHPLDDNKPPERVEESAATLAPAAPPPPPPPAAAMQIKGAGGRAASVRVEKVASVEDDRKFYEYIREMPEVVELLQKLATRTLKNGLLTADQIAAIGLAVKERAKVS